MFGNSKRSFGPFLGLDIVFFALGLTAPLMIYTAGTEATDAIAADSDPLMTCVALTIGVMVLSAIAVAGIPGGSLPLIAGLLFTFGIPAEGIGIILGVDRILDMCRTTVNVGCDLVTAVIVDKTPPGPGAAEPAIR